MTTTQQPSSVPQFHGFDHPFFPSAGRPYSHCDCGIPDACGAPHVAKAYGAPHAIQHKHHPYTHWNGQLALLDVKPKKHGKYQPPSLPFVCDRPMPGSQSCAVPRGSDTCPP